MMNLPFLPMTQALSRVKKDRDQMADKAVTIEINPYI